MRALVRVDPSLHEKFLRQRDKFDAACLAGTTRDIEVHGEATCRGYAACTRALEAAQEPDDAYMLGLDTVSGLRVAVGHHRAPATPREDGAVWITPDEVATLLAASPVVLATKRAFPGAAVVDRQQRWAAE